MFPPLCVFFPQTNVLSLTLVLLHRPMFPPLCLFCSTDECSHPYTCFVPQTMVPILMFVLFHRRMFPPLRLTFSDLDMDSTYSLYVDIVPVDSLRYRYSYHQSTWVVAGDTSESHPSSLPPPPPRSPYEHPDGPFSGLRLLQRSGSEAGVVSFNKLKITNSFTNNSSASAASSHQVSKYT